MDIEQKIEHAEKAWSEIDPENGATVPDHAWGFSSYGDAPGGIGGGFVAFVWKATRDEVLNFIRDVLPYSPPGRSDKDWEAVAKETEEIVEEMRAGAVSDDEGVNRLNAALVTFSQIEFFGRFGDLMSGDDQYPQKIRAEYLNEVASMEGSSNDYDESGAKPIPPLPEESRAHFVEWLTMYGV
ncbi:hypothetical protein FP2506_01090 [Fulvimarina pelagi HTCC2506]|uniref:Uncharacterized protein n=1 Tax=Fulvimarina pelagi HTCC2506 TaxID=314231 RepID=Q0G279_9HYPH|nr:hypothetical protein [Fulvimarina pelagi]EAU41319.1 hypothetical protein FP2506_01090 [Fulvimarina pelagi HTCC2506]